jgi:hypothetical protein
MHGETLKKGYLLWREGYLVSGMRVEKKQNKQAENQRIV